MSKFFLDTNVLLDIVSVDRPCNEIAYEFVMKAFLTGHHCLYASAGAFKDVYYIFCRHYGMEHMARRAVQMLRESVDVVGLDDNVLSIALYDDEPDFEDGIVRVSAELAGCDYIVTRDKAAYKESTVSSVSIEEALRIVDS